jgi:hypothetical protein
MNTYKKIIKYLEHGILPIVRDKDGDYMICESKDKDDNINVSEYKKTKEELVLDNGISYSQDEIMEKNWQIVGIYDIPKIPFEVGDKVRIRPDLAEIFDTSDWSDEKKKMIGKVHQIGYINKYSNGLSYGIKDCVFRHEWIEPAFEDDRTIEDVISGLSEEDKEIVRRAMR